MTETLLHKTNKNAWWGIDFVKILNQSLHDVSYIYKNGFHAYIRYDALHFVFTTTNYCLTIWFPFKIKINMKAIKITFLSFISLMAFIGMYVSFETSHQCNILASEVDSIKISQSKIEYKIKNQQDTIIIINNLNITQK